ncbi:hypothetical protein JOC94_002303 [Bacillus thermophilus]|uniref:Uncharacterized protein n=1 Tax=Siminovitchia thermophila TaxID=1245522 RepID=A0ABS2R6N5_9BACI|nr:hypothetical protein [Siminovitchia thermophila]MBM7715316.1 hypothetical protein [Siminovitchia thermophila]
MARKQIAIAYYEKTDEQKRRYISYMRNKIRKGDDAILQSMMELVERHLKKYHADFYVHDISLYRNTEGAPFLWIVREYGTHFVDLYSKKFLDNEVWDAKAHFEAILFNSRKEIKGIYLIENGKMQKLSEQSALATLAIKESIVRKNLECDIKKCERS